MPGNSQTTHGPKDVPFKIGEMCGIMTVAGPVLRIQLPGRNIHKFERNYSGCPWFLNKVGDPTHTPGERHPFWKPFNRWLREGAKVDGDLCIWAPAPKAAVKRIGKCAVQFVHVPEGWHEDDGVYYVAG
jgi:hypothetical protein